MLFVVLPGGGHSRHYSTCTSTWYKSHARNTMAAASSENSNGVHTKRKRDDCDEEGPVASTLTSVSCTSIGTRASQEDRFIVVNNGWENVAEAARSWPTCRFFGIFDGHSGEAAAELATSMLWPKLQALLVELQQQQPTPETHPPEEALERAMREAFEATDARILAEAGEAGSTAAVALVLGERLCVAHIGDSRTVLCRSERVGWSTADHKPDEPAERARIEAAGGHVATPQVAGQINVPRLNGVLSVSRAFGDAAFKGARARDVDASGEGAGGEGVGGVGSGGAGGLTAEPDVMQRDLDTRFDTFLLLASDGLWDFMSNSTAVEICLEELSRRWPVRTLGQRAQKACDRLVREAVCSGHCMDNVTAVLAMLTDEV